MKQLLLGVVVCALALTGTTFAQFENFDCATPNFLSCTVGNDGFPYNGWTDGGSTGSSFRVDANGTGSFNTGPSDDLTGGGNYVYLETSCGGAGPFTGILNSPVYDATGVAVPTFRFWFHMFGAAMGTMSVEESDGAGGWTQIWTMTGDQGDIWTLVEVPVNTYMGAGGPEAQIRFVGMRGTSFTSDMAFDNCKFGEPGPPPPPPTPIHQANTPTASLDIDGVECIDFSMGMCGFVVPEQRSFDAGALMNWTISSGANGQQPYALFLTPGFGVNATSPGIPTVAGIVDFSVGGFTTLDAVIDGIGGTDFLDQFLGDTTASGTRNLQFSNPGGMPGSTFASAQALVVDPTAGFGIQLTAATQVDNTIGGGGSGLPAAFTGQNPLAGLTDDNTVNFVFSMGLSLPFYGASYTDCWVNSNGSVSFGLGGDTDLSESIFDLENEEARVAGLWDDLNPAAGGTVATTDTATDLVVSFTGVPEFGTTNNNNFGISMNGTTGTVRIAYGNVALNDALTGISPGNNSPGGLPNPGVAMNLATAIPGTIIGTANDSIFDLFTTNPGYGIATSPCAPPVAGTLLVNFIPNPPTAVPGDAGYTAP